MDYTVVFDVAREGYRNWRFPAFGLIFVSLGSKMVFAPELAVRLMPWASKRRPSKVAPAAFLAFAVLWTSVTFALTYTEYRIDAGRLQSGDYQVVEGQVTRFVPMPARGHAMESFVVGGRRFSYSDYVLTAGFNNTSSHGGPVGEGLRVRISYAGNTILRLEVVR